MSNVDVKDQGKSEHGDSQRAIDRSTGSEHISASDVVGRIEHSSKGHLRPINRDTDRAVQLVLASGSPSKRAILENLGVQFDIDPAEIDETQFDALSIEQRVASLAHKKAELVASRHPRSLIVAADTLICDELGCLGKPQDEQDAVATLVRLSGRAHDVVTGLYLLDSSDRRARCTVTKTTVSFRELSFETIERYVRTQEPLNKAGGYALQGIGAMLIHRIEGESSNVMGLPISAFINALDSLGYRLL